MLKTRPIRHFNNDLDKRWMTDDYFDLVVWYDGVGDVYGLELGYDKLGLERVLRWRRGQGYLHAQVDGGGGAFSHMSPVLGASWIEFPLEEVHREFMGRTVELDPGIRQFVADHLVEYGRVQHGAATGKGE